MSIFVCICMHIMFQSKVFKLVRTFKPYSLRSVFCLFLSKTIIAEISSDVTSAACHHCHVTVIKNCTVYYVVCFDKGSSRSNMEKKKINIFKSAMWLPTKSVATTISIFDYRCVVLHGNHHRSWKAPPSSWSHINIKAAPSDTQLVSLIYKQGLQKKSQKNWNSKLS